MGIRRGRGFASLFYGIGNTGVPNPAGAFVDLLADGSALVLVGCADIGQGSSTVIAQVVAAELGIPVERVTVVAGDTGVTPDGGATSASRQTYVSGNAARQAAAAARRTVLGEAAAMLGCHVEQLAVGEGRVYRLDDPTVTVPLAEVLGRCRAKGVLTLGHGWFNPATTPLDPDTGQGEPYATYTFGTQMAEVEVDTETGQVRVVRLVAAHDVGRAINPRNVEGQIEGGAVFGLGYALMEEVVLREGRILTPSLTEYRIPTALDVPPIESLIVEEPEETGPFGAKGFAESSLIPTAAAVTAAVYDAVGVWITSLPITPEKVLAALEEKKGRE